jgi:hypothetical protein
VSRRKCLSTIQWRHRQLWSKSFVGLATIGLWLLLSTAKSSLIKCLALCTWSERERQPRVIVYYVIGLRELIVSRAGYRRFTWWRSEGHVTFGDRFEIRIAVVCWPMIFLRSCKFDARRHLKITSRRLTITHSWYDNVPCHGVTRPLVGRTNEQTRERYRTNAICRMSWKLSIYTWRVVCRIKPASSVYVARSETDACATVRRCTALDIRVTSSG